MKLYTSIGPNPRTVRMFMAEKGIELPKIEVDIRGGENRREPYTRDVNPHGQTPALEMKNGKVLAEIIPICEYLEEIYPTPALIGATAEERAETRMWVRRFDLNICEPMGLGFRSSQGMKMFKDRMKLIPSGADELKAMAQDRIAWLDTQMAGKQFVCGDRLTLADIYLFCFLDFGAGIGQALNPENKNVAAWFERMKQRPSTAA